MDKDYVAGVVGELRAVLGEGYAISVNEVLKNNGVRKCAVCIRKDGENVSPNFYLEEMLRDAWGDTWHSEADAARLIAEAYEGQSYSGLAGRIREEVSCMSKEKILGSVSHRLVNREKNADILENSPYVPFLDLAAVFQVEVPAGEELPASFRVSNGMCEAYGIELRELDEAARRNAGAQGFRCVSMDNMMSEITGLPAETFRAYGFNPWMYVLTNSSKMYGASVLMYPQHLSGLAERLGDDLFVLPSSIHEVIAVPADGMEPAKLRDAVREVNAGEVTAEETLSDSVYRWSDGALSIA